MADKIANELGVKSNEIWDKLSQISKIVLNHDSKNLQIEWLNTLSAISEDLGTHIDCFESSLDNSSDCEITDDFRDNKLNNLN
jgi:hypothetical protein